MDVLVDLDGTLVDPKPGLIGSFQHALRQLGAPVPPADELTWVIGPPLRVSFPKVLGDAMRTEEALAHYREHYRNGAMYDAIVYDGIVDALDRLSHGRLPPDRRHVEAARLCAADPRAPGSGPPLRRRARPRARRHQRPQGRPDRPHHRPRGHRPRAGRHDRRPRVRRDSCGPQRHSRHRRHLGLRQRARSCAPPAPSPLCDRPAELPTTVLARALGSDPMAPSRSAGSGVR